MTEIFIHYAELNSSEQDLYQKSIEEFELIGKRPPDDDHVIGALSQRLHYEAQNNDEFAGVLGSVIKARLGINADTTGSAIAGIFRCALMNDQIQMGNNPTEYKTAEDWAIPIDWMLNGLRQLDGRSERLYMNLHADPIGTNPYTRATPVELTMQVLAPRFMPEGIRMLDEATGMGEVVSQLLTKDRYRFDPVSVYDSVERGPVAKWRPSEAKTAKALELLARPSIIRECVAVDLIDPRHSQHNQAFSRASLRPEVEIGNAATMKKYDGMQAEDLPNLTFQQLDIASRSDIAKFRRSQTEGFDWVSKQTVDNMLNPRERIISDAGALLMANEGGVIFKSDFLHYTAAQPNRAYHYSRWHKFGHYRAYIFDSERPEIGWQELFIMDSRCKRIVLGTGMVAINGETAPFNELFMAA